MKLIFKIICMMLFAFISCKKDKEITPVVLDADIQLSISHNVNGASLYFDSLAYTNDAGNIYEINKLEYYVSNITFFRNDSVIYKNKNVYYINAQSTNNHTILLNSVPFGNYSRVTFNVGLDSIHNLDYFLPNTTENINMVWPTIMGGGYHFLKLEGHYLIAAVPSGYAIHLGNKSIVNCIINDGFILSSNNTSLELKMDINEWYKTPQLYNFNTDGNFTMGDSLLMNKIAANGYNAFSIKH